MANPSGTHHQDASHAPSSFNGANPSNGAQGPESSGTALKHNPGISTEWTIEEQALLEDGLKNYPATEASVIRYAKIAMHLQNKTVRDVALRARWLSKKEYSKRRKDDLARKSKDKKERAVDLSVNLPSFMAQQNTRPYTTSTPVFPMDYDDGINYHAIDGVTGELLKQNAQAFNQISANLSVLKIQENLSLLTQTRDNLLKIMNDMNDIPEIMRQMPPIPVKLNEDLANTILAPPNFPNGRQ